MSAILELLTNLPTLYFGAGVEIITQGSPTGPMWVLLDGAVEVLRDHVRVAKGSEPGLVFGEMSVLLGVPHTATVRTIASSRFAVIEDPQAFLANSAPASLHVARLLAHRLDALNKYLIDVKNQYEGHDHIGMVDEVLQTLLHRQRN